MILLFVLRHSLTYEATTDLLNLIVPYPNNIPKSLQQFLHFMNNNCTKYQRHYYCSECHDNLMDSELSRCPTCSTNLSSSPPGSFSILSIEDQLQSLFKSTHYMVTYL